MRSRLRTVQGKSALFLTPSLIGTVLLFVLPFSVVIFYALTEHGTFAGLKNFAWLLQNDAFRLAAAMFLAAEPVSFKATSVPSKLSLTTCSAASPELFIAFVLLSLRLLVLPDGFDFLPDHAGAYGNIVT